ncbi:tRNA uridine-5-carboxymethylaminomethyl(34) synthesis GTPase MnmE [bacterium]|nr:tRNA uridine-5-carboxymethylaminomethyl(34) synthesis GTPase MnmE [bacterium]
MSGYDTTDTIVAPATAPAASAIGIIRLSGSNAWAIAGGLLHDVPRSIQPRHAYVSSIAIGEAGGQETLDTAVATFWRAPVSYTGEDMAEFSLHGNPLILRCVAAQCVSRGARMAEAGEFTFRAYLAGKLDLAQAEAVHELITAGSTRALEISGTSLAGLPSKQARQWVSRLTGLQAEIEVIHDYAADSLDSSLDQAALLTQEKLDAQLAAIVAELDDAIEVSRRTAPLRTGITAAICGPPNVGKSTLFNALLGHDRALTAPEPGTTRDYLTETLDAGGIKLTLIDTAGYREAEDAIEAAGVRRAGDWSRSADRVLWITAADIQDEDKVPAAPSARLHADVPGGRHNDVLHVVTRCDLLAAWPNPEPTVFHVSGLTGQGVPALWEALHDLPEQLMEGCMQSFSERQAQRIREARDLLRGGRKALAAGIPMDAVASDIAQAREALHGIYEHADRGAVIECIFSSFCVGK